MLQILGKNPSSSFFYYKIMTKKHSPSILRNVDNFPLMHFIPPLPGKHPRYNQTQKSMCSSGSHQLMIRQMHLFLAFALIMFALKDVPLNICVLSYSLEHLKEQKTNSKCSKYRSVKIYLEEILLKKNVTSGNVFKRVYILLTFQ